LTRITIIQLIQHSGSFGRRQKIVLVRNKKKYLPNTRKRKIVITGDSHARGYVAEISSGLAKDFEVS
jgi:hypothetical protein